MPGTGSNSTREAIRLTRAATQRRGRRRPDGRAVLQQADAGRLLPPLRRRGRGCDLPIVLYNIPGRTGSNILPETIARLAELPNIVAVKEATGSLDQASHIASLCDLTILSGDDSLTLPLMSIGGRGVVSVVGNIVPRDLKALVSAFDAGRTDEALKWHRKLFHAVPRPARRRRPIRSRSRRR